MVVVPSSGAPARSGVGGKPTLLIIDRQPLFTAALDMLLTSSPLEARVEVCSDTNAGLALAVAGGVQLVFCEIRSGPIAPIELAERLHELVPPVPLILLGDPEDERLMAGALNSKVAGFFTKDASLEEFMVGVQAVMSGHRAVGSNLMGSVLERLSTSSPNGHRGAHQLSPTELDILTMIGQAKSIPVIAAARGITNKTVRNHLANIYRKLELRSRTEAMLLAAKMGLTAG